MRVSRSGPGLLVPVRVRLRAGTDRIEAGHLLSVQFPRSRGEIVAQLLLVACAQDHRIHARFAANPIEGHLSWRDAAPGGDLEHDVHNAIKPLPVHFDRRSQRGQPAFGWLRRVAANLARKQPEHEWAPHHHTHTLVKTHRNQLIFGVADQQRVLDLLADIARQAAIRSESSPNMSGLHTITPTPWSRPIGISSYSASRTSKEYWICWLT